MDAEMMFEKLEKYIEDGYQLFVELAVEEELMQASVDFFEVIMKNQNDEEKLKTKAQLVANMMESTITTL